MSRSEYKRAYDREYRRLKRAGMPTVSSPASHSVAAQRPSGAMMAERDRRLAALSQASITGTVFGDPPPGFSALERRR
jgi:hypothetical protein